MDRLRAAALYCGAVVGLSAAAGATTAAGSMVMPLIPVVLLAVAIGISPAAAGYALLIQAPLLSPLALGLYVAVIVTHAAFMVVLSPPAGIASRFQYGCLQCLFGPVFVVIDGVAAWA